MRGKSSIMPSNDPPPPTPLRTRPSSRLKGRLLVLALSLFLSGAGFAEVEEPKAPSAPQAEGGAVLAALVPRPGAATPEEPELRTSHVVTRGAIRQGDTLASSFARADAPSRLAFRIARLMKGHYDFRKRARAGHEWDLVTDADQSLVDFRYRTTSMENYHLFRGEDGEFTVRLEQAELVERLARLEGVVETTLYDAVVERGEDPQLARDFTDIFAWDVDFSREVEPGDEFRVLYEQLFRIEEDGSEVYVGPGLILAARYRSTPDEHVAVYFETEEGRGGYYRPDGSSVRGRFLKAPLRFVRISSDYSHARLHPILKVKRPHHGVDYAAPYGEPVWSVADGKVIYRGWAGGFGNLVKVRHKNGYVSYYAHLSRFARGLRVGSQVQQKQVIGYVGRSGLATGPHVCFRIARDGAFVNPTALRLPSGEPVPAAVKSVFVSTRDLLLAELEAGPLLASDATN